MTHAVARKAAKARTTHRRRGRHVHTEAELIAALRAWAVEHGEPPRAIDWDPARARRLPGHAWRADRFEAGVWPTARMLTKRFGTFNAAVAAAGFKPRRSPARVRANLAGPDAVLDAIRAWVKLYGDVPTLADWDTARARRLGQEWRVVRYQDGDWPSARTVIARHGSFSAAIRAAGLAPRAPGEQYGDRRPVRTQLRLLVARELSRTAEPGLEGFAASLRSLAQARRHENPESIHGALIDVAASALAWAGAIQA